MILPRYEEAFASLNDAHLARLVPALSLPPMHPAGRPWRGADLVAHCREAHISHADVIMSLAQDRTPEAVAAVEVLIMRPIDRRTPYEVNISRLERPPGSHREPRAGTTRSVAASLEDRMVVRLVAQGNPKRPGSESYLRFAIYQDGMTVAAFLAAGGRRADVKWDQEKGHVRLEEPTSADA